MDPDVLLQLAIDEDWDDELALLATLLEDDASRVFDKAFDLAIFTVSECVDFFRFSPPNILLLCHLLGMPGTMIASNGESGHGTKASGKCTNIGYFAISVKYYF